jgi:outer membrane protein assembly factor BamB
VLWKQLAAEKKPTISTHRTNTYASETPVTDGQRVYAYFGMTGVYAYDMEGKLAWSKDLGSYSMRNGWGTGSSPALDAERLYIQCDNEDKSFLVALDKKTGAEVWRAPRSNEGSSWSTPYLWKNKVRTELVAVGRTVRGYDPATGKVLWELGGVEGRVAATPVGDEAHLYVGTGGGQSGGGPLFAIKAGASGDITLKDDQSSGEGVAWSAQRSGPSMPSPLLFKGHLYVLDQRGTLACYDAATGKQAYRERLPDARQFAASPWAYDGKLFCLDEEGQTHVVQTGAEFKVLAKNPVGETCWASPAIAQGALFLRGAEHLFCIKQ